MQNFIQFTTFNKTNFFNCNILKIMLKYFRDQILISVSSVNKKKYLQTGKIKILHDRHSQRTFLHNILCRIIQK